MNHVQRPNAITAIGAALAPRQRSVLAALLAVLGIALCVGAQAQLAQQRVTPLGLIALGLGWSAWISALLVAPPRHDDQAPLIEQRRTFRWTAAGAALLLAGACWRSTSAGVYTAQNVALWIATGSVWLWACWPGSIRSPHVVRLPSRQQIGVLALLIGVIAAGTWLRVHRLADVPLDPTSDHAEKLLDVNDLIQGQRPIFFPRNTGREPGQFYLTFALMRLFDLPLRFETLKLGTALIGALTIPAIFLFARELAGRNVGLIAAALFAISEWPINTARMGLRFPYAPLPTALVLWLLLRYLRRGDRRDAIVCGLVIGLGLHGYIAFRIVPLLVPLLLGVAYLIDRRWRSHGRTLLIDGGLIVGTALLTCLPLVHYSVQHPDQVWYRVATRAAATERQLGATLDQISTFATNNRNALLAFNWRGDSTLVNAVQNAPFLDVVTGGCFLAGLIVLAYHTIRWRAPRFIMVLVAIPVLLLPSTLSIAFPNENPSANRLGTVMPIIFTIAALPLGYLLHLRPRFGAKRPTAVGRGAAMGLIGALLAVAAQQNYVRYFRTYDQQYRAFVPNIHAIVETVELWQGTGVSRDNTYLLSYPYWLDGRNVAIAMGDLAWQPTHDLTSDKPLPPRAPQQSMLFVLNLDDVERQQALSTQFPDGQLMPIDATDPGRDFALYLVPAR